MSTEGIYEGLIFSREVWGAMPPKKTPTPLKAQPREVWVHHSVTEVTADPCADMRKLQRVGFGRGYNDVSYSFAIHPSGVILEGRGWDVEGAHTSGHNGVSVGVCFVGDYTTRELTPQQIEAFRWLVHEGHSTGKLADNAALGLHRDLKPTACPGTNVVARMAELRLPCALPGSPQAPPPPPAPPAPAIPPTLRRGDRGVHVQHLQSQLNIHGFPLDQDGDFGPKTERAVKAFQKARKLVADGVCGPRTWAAVLVDRPSA